MSNTIVAAGLGVPGTGLPWAALRNAVREASAGQMYDGSGWWEGLDGLEQQPEDGWSARQAFEWIARAKAHLDDQVVRLHKALRDGAPDIAVLRRRGGWLVVAGGFQGFEDLPSFDALLDLSESGIFEMAGVTPFGGWDAPLAGRTLGLDTRTTFRFEAADEIWRALDAQGHGRKVDARVAAVLDDIDHRDQSIRPDGLLVNTTLPPKLEEVCMRRSESAHLYVFTCAETGPDVEGGAAAAAKVGATAACVQRSKTDTTSRPRWTSPTARPCASSSTSRAGRPTSRCCSNAACNELRALSGPIADWTPMPIARTFSRR